MLKRYLKRRGIPWEILAVALLFFVPGLVLLLQRGPVPFYNARFPNLPPTVMSAAAAHILGGSGVLFAALLVFLYVYACFKAKSPAIPPDAASFEHHRSPTDESPLANGSERSRFSVFERLRSLWRDP